MQARNSQNPIVTKAMSMINMAGKRKRWEEAERQRKERGNGEEAATVLTVFLREMRPKAEELMQQSEMAGAASVLAGLSAQAHGVVGRTPLALRNKETIVAGDLQCLNHRCCESVLLIPPLGSPQAHDHHH